MDKKLMDIEFKKINDLEKGVLESLKVAIHFIPSDKKSYHESKLSLLKKIKEQKNNLHCINNLNQAGKIKLYVPNMYEKMINLQTLFIDCSKEYIYSLEQNDYFQLKNITTNTHPLPRKEIREMDSIIKNINN